MARGFDQDRNIDLNRVSNNSIRHRQVAGVINDNKVSIYYGNRVCTAEWHGSETLLQEGEQGIKASFYVTNFPDRLPLFRLRQAFEVCGILTDVYVAPYRNARGQEFGFVRLRQCKEQRETLSGIE